MDKSEDTLLAQLSDALHIAMRDAVAQAQRNHAGERFYAYVLYTSPLFTYAVLTFNTEEALARMAPSEEQRRELRWRASEWEYNFEGEELSKPVDDILDSLLRLPDAYEEPHYNRRREVFMEVLKRLDAEGVFGTGETRQFVLVNIMWGDEDVVAHVNSARELNPMSSYLEYARYVLPMLHGGAKEVERSAMADEAKEEALARIRRTIAQVEEDLRRGN